MVRHAKPHTEDALRRMFAATIRQRREQMEMSQEELAARTDLSTSYIGLLERSQRNLTMLTASRLAHAFELELSAFVALAETHPRG